MLYRLVARLVEQLCREKSVLYGFKSHPGHLFWNKEFPWVQLPSSWYYNVQMLLSYDSTHGIY